MGVSLSVEERICRHEQGSGVGDGRVVRWLSASGEDGGVEDVGRDTVVVEVRRCRRVQLRRTGLRGGRGQEGRAAQQG